MSSLPLIDAHASEVSSAPLSAVSAASTTPAAAVAPVALSRLFRGTLIHAPEWGAGVQILEDHLLAVAAESGRIVIVEPYSDAALARITGAGGAGDGASRSEPCFLLPPEGLTTLSATQFLIPGFIDTHCHAPQFQFAGTGTDRDLMVWLQTYTFPAEVRMQDPKFAAHVYDRLVRAALAAGTTTAFYYGTIHLEGTQALVDACVAQGQRAFVGKVNMDQHSPADYCETTAKSLEDTEAFVRYCRALPPHGRQLIEPVITPRFIPTCSAELLTGLGAIAARHGGLWIQSHASESADQVDFVSSLHPEVGSAPKHVTCEVEQAGLQDGRCTGIFAHHGLLTNKCMMAHGTFLRPSEWNVFRTRGVSLAHCPLSNSFCSNDYLKLKPLVNNGNKVGLGSDVAGGYALSILHGVRQAVITSKFHTADITAHPEKEIHVGPNGAHHRHHHHHHRDAAAHSAGDAAAAATVAAAVGCTSAASTRVLSASALAAQDAARAANDNTVNSSTLSYADAFWLATAGGAEAINMSSELGRLSPGFLFDAQLIDVAPVDPTTNTPLHTQLHLFPSDSLRDTFQKFIHLADDRHVAEVFVHGRKVKGRGVSASALAASSSSSVAKVASPPTIKAAAVMPLASDAAPSKVEQLLSA